ncbi:hypothetical protein ACEWY4_016772 [Coilia grayii]|uniref:Small membrane A-kinase anchor protein n=1 Tax=Coilia grayii TaxID=363190 RepID=A0ABD1JLH4_9TELE
MGCFKSKHEQLSDLEYRCEGKAGLVLDSVVDESTALLQFHDSGPPLVKPPSPSTNLMLLDYAQRMAEEIVALAVQHWKELDRQFGDIPYIDSD